MSKHHQLKTSSEVKILKRTSSSRVQKPMVILNAHYKLSIWETRIFTKLIMMLDHEDEDDKNYRIYAHDVIDDFQLQHNESTYDQILKAGTSLMKRKVVFTEKSGDGTVYEVHTSILSAVVMITDDNTDTFIKAYLNRALKSRLLDLREYCVYDLENILNLPDPYTFRLYEVLNGFAYRKHQVVPLEELKTMIGTAEIVHNENGERLVNDSYPLFNDFEQDIIRNAQKIINDTTDISFTYDPIKKGSKVNAISFRVAYTK